MKCPAPSWWSNYINRIPNERFFELFTSAENRPFGQHGGKSGPGYKLYYLDLQWEGHKSVEHLNAYDEDRYIHQLEVDLYDGGLRSGRIRAVRERHDVIFHSSEWLGHSHTEGSYNVRPPTDKEIAEYTKILDETTTSDVDLVAVDLLIAKSAAEDSFRWNCGEGRGPVGSDDDPLPDFSPAFYWSGRDVCPVEISRIQQAYEHLESLLSVDGLLDYVDLGKFYVGMEFERLKQAMLDRFMNDCANCLELVGMSKLGWSAMIKIRLDEYLRDKFKRNVNDENNFMLRECSRCRSAAGIGRNLFFFNRKRLCLGCVAPNGWVFDADGKRLGGINNNGEVLDVASNIVARCSNGPCWMPNYSQCIKEEREQGCSYYCDNRSGCWFYGEGFDKAGDYAGFAREFTWKGFEYIRQMHEAVIRGYYSQYSHKQDVDLRFLAIPLFMKK